MRDPEMFKYDVRVRDRMLRAGRISNDEINGILEALPDTESECEIVPLNQPAIELATAPVANTRPSYLPAPLSEVPDESPPEVEAST